MNEQWKYGLKVVLAVIMIMALPVFFFQYIGDDPLRVSENATRKIAVVNEDLGVGGEDGKRGFDLGASVAPMLAEGSDFEWMVLTRATANQKLIDGEYDAVIYIPSDFSKNTLTYTDEKPAKVSLQYQVQNQLNATNKQRVVRELEAASTKVSDDITSRYWNYVSQEINDLRGKFDSILEKEIQFQQTMLSFYKPGSKNLAGELDNQKKLLEQMQSNIQSAETGSDNRKQDVQQVEKNLVSFVDYVEQYRQYQREQENLLRKAQVVSLQSMEEAVKGVNSRQSQSRAELNNQANKMMNGLSSLEQRLNKQVEMADELQTAQQNQASEQESKMKLFNDELLEQYRQQEAITAFNEIEASLLPLREQLESGGSPNPNPGNPGVPADETPPPSEEDVLQEERAELTDIAAKVQEAKETLEAMPGEKTEEVTKVITSLAELTSRIQAVEQQLADVNTNQSNNELRQQLQQLTQQYTNLLRQYEQAVQNNGVDVTDLVKKIEQKEAELVSSSLLSQERKTRLNNAFSKEIGSTDIDDLFNYYEYLSKYEQALKQMGRTDTKEVILNSEETNRRTQSILFENRQSQEISGVLQENLASTQEQSSLLNEDAKAFVSQYSENINQEYELMMNDLSVIQDRASNISDILQNSSNDVNTDAVDPNVSKLVTLQQSMGQELQGLNDLLVSLGERQSNVVQYTGDLQKQVNDVQEKADSLNSKWAENVDSTKLVRGDVYNLLNNAFVNGQPNSDVYRYLANPVEVKGEVPAEKVKEVPPVVILVIILISSLLIGYFIHYYQSAPLFVRGSLFGLLNLIVGLMISVFSLNIYTLSDERAIEWSVYTILLLVVSSLLVRSAFLIGPFVGWIVTIVMMMLYINPLLSLAMPNFHYDDPVSKVYMSIQYNTHTLFTEAIIVLLGIMLVLIVIPAVASYVKKGKQAESDHTYEA
ncbi:type VII secretion protein EsaA [Metabacillus iocasae]|uniref:Type VII secretion EsaA-like protein n=1 Tax=Priestia iocasae TaxID=2291674 RepID=A0ABS2QU98_9BACI|nr:type VII secretion protein EsaA [Metabacillus iocasae]MBM7703050.1 type VII secretion EsaA-like protein [Metabacillus iocasae]